MTSGAHTYAHVCVSHTNAVHLFVWDPNTGQLARAAPTFHRRGTACTCLRAARSTRGAGRRARSTGGASIRWRRVRALRLHASAALGLAARSFLFVGPAVPCELCKYAARRPLADLACAVPCARCAPSGQRWAGNWLEGKPVWVHPLPSSDAAAAGGAAEEGVAAEVADNLAHAAAACKTAQEVRHQGLGACSRGGGQGEQLAGRDRGAAAVGRESWQPSRAAVEMPNGAVRTDPLVSSIGVKASGA